MLSKSVSSLDNPKINKMDAYSPANVAVECDSLTPDENQMFSRILDN